MVLGFFLGGSSHTFSRFGVWRSRFSTVFGETQHYRKTAVETVLLLMEEILHHLGCTVKDLVNHGMN